MSASRSARQGSYLADQWLGGPTENGDSKLSRGCRDRPEGNVEKDFVIEELKDVERCEDAHYEEGEVEQMMDLSDRRAH
jgi:hypothetical protein